jgi:hypothetical protein
VLCQACRERPDPEPDEERADPFLAVLGSFDGPGGEAFREALAGRKDEERPFWWDEPWSELAAEHEALESEEARV